MISFILFTLFITAVLPICVFLFFNWFCDWLIDNDYKQWVVNIFLGIYIIIMIIYVYAIVRFMIGLM